MYKVIKARQLKAMFLSGTRSLSGKREWINELNVFPVPDGDTGTNMMLTLMNAVDAIRDLSDDAGLHDVCSCIALGTLRGARGNSGVIMSQLCRGFAKECENVDEVDKDVIKRAFERAVATAYKAVMKPKEGTMLTVAKAGVLKAEELCGTDMSMEEYLGEIIAYQYDVLQKTPDMLPVLKEAGVVDSGGQGLYEFLKGAHEALVNDYDINDIVLTDDEGGYVHSGGRAEVDSSDIETSDIKFGYCTEYIIELDKDFGESEENAFKSFLSSIGDSLVCVSMENIVKVHVHTDHPGQAIEKALEYGALTNLKIDNMRMEHNEKVIKEADRKAFNEKNEAAVRSEPEAGPSPSDVTAQFCAPKRKEAGFVTVCSGDGIADIFKGMSVDEVIEGGQTMNPSTEDIIAAIDRVNADNVFIFPNNSNIILAANQAAGIYEGKNVVVIPTKTVVQGINAFISYVPALSVEDNTVQMTEAAADIKTGEVTYSIRDTEIDGQKINKGDYMGIADGHIASAGTDIKQVVIDTVKYMSDDMTELITIYYGAEADSAGAEAISEELEAILEDADIEVAYGGQPVYYYIISAE